jgi:hypothetical protein
VSRRLVVVVCVGLAALIVMGIPASAMAAKNWFVRDKAGHRQGYVSPGTDDYGNRQGYVMTMAIHGAFRGYVFHETQDGWAGWIVENIDGRWVAMITKSSSTRYAIAGDGARGLAQRTAAGYWVIRKRVNGTYRKIGTVQKGCPGYYALGAARLLIWR